MAVNPLRKTAKRLKTEPFETTSLKETINHINIQQKKEQDLRNEDFETCERSIRAHEPKISSLVGRKYWESSFWDHIHGDKDT